MYSGASISMKMATKSSKVKTSTGSRAPYLAMSLLVITAAICATTQVLASKLNNTIIPPLSLSLDDALQYLSRASNK